MKWNDTPEGRAAKSDDGRLYAVELHGSRYNAYCDGKFLDDFISLKDAQAWCERHAGASAPVRSI